MVSSLKKVSAVLISLVCALTMSSFALVPQAQAKVNKGQWFFSFSKADGKHYCGPVLKNTAVNYVDVSINKGDNVFVEGKSKLCLRTRYASNPDKKASYQYTFTKYHDSFHMKYLEERGAVRTNYLLAGAVSSKSQTNVIQVWGYWTP